ncbi:MAG: class I SAM-dependent methyltransferase [bacterium]
MKRPLILGNAFYSSKENHLFADPKDLLKARNYFLEKKPSTLNYLLEKRYTWMNSFINDGDSGIEIGSGTGLSKLFIKSKNLILTDFVKNDWIDDLVDAHEMPYENSSLDFIIASNMIHHLAMPYKFMEECSRVLKSGGRIIIQDVYLSLLLRALARIANHEGYSYDVDVFKKNSVFSDNEDLWGCNLAVPIMLFADHKKFEKCFNYKIIFSKYTECLLWPLSGGIAPVSKKVNLPRSVLKIVDLIDNALISISRNIFALQLQIILQKD